MLKTLETAKTYIFSDEPGTCKYCQHEINVTNTIPFKYKTYPVPVNYQKAVS